jgi:hypothetical protein
LTEKPQTIGEQSDNFFRAVGRAISDWANIDAEIFTLCSAIMEANERHVAIVYYGNTSISLRVTLADNLINTIFPISELNSGGHAHPLQAAWRRLIKDLRAELQVRNQLAHSPVALIVTETDGVDGIVKTDIGWASYRSDSELLAKPQNGTNELRVEELDAYVARIRSLYGRIREIRKDIEDICRKNIALFGSTVVPRG